MHTPPTDRTTNWRCAGAIIGYKLPAGVGAALEADADAVDDRGEGQRGGQRGRRAVETEERHPNRLQRLQRNPRHEGPATKPCRVTKSAGASGGPLLGPESSTAAEVNRQWRLLAMRFVAASVECETVPTKVMGRPPVVTVAVTDGDEFAMRLTPKWGCRGKSGPEGRMTSIHGAPPLLRA